MHREKFYLQLYDVCAGVDVDIELESIGRLIWVVCIYEMCIFSSFIIYYYAKHSTAV